MPLICQNKNTIISLQFQIAIPFYSIRKIAVFEKNIRISMASILTGKKFAAIIFTHSNKQNFQEKKSQKIRIFFQNCGARVTELSNDVQ